MISIVIPNYNGKKYLKNCIDAIYKKVYLDKSEFEVIVIDNASKDDDFKWISQYKDIKFVALDKNYGFSRAVNEGIKISSGEYVILLNNDTEILEEFVEELFNCIDSDDKIFSACSKMIQYHDKDLIDDAGDEYNLLGWAYKRGDGKDVESYSKAQEVFSSCAGAAIYRKSIFDEIGLFDESFFAYMEDVDISYRARIHGYKNIYCPDAKVYHIGSATSGSKYNDFKIELAARNNIFVPYKNMPFLQLLINFPFLFVGFLVKYLFFLRRGFGEIYIKGLVDGLKMLKDIKKVKFKWKNLPNYINIEYLLIKNMFGYILYKLKK